MTLIEKRRWIRLKNLKKIASRLLLAVFLLVPICSASTERRMTVGIANNNPGNVRPLNWRVWPGAVGVNGHGYMIFRAPQYGIRAIRVILLAYQIKHGIRSPHGIIYRWVDKEADEHQKQEYTKELCRRLGNIDEYCRLDLRNKKTMWTVIRAIVFYENGYDPYGKYYYDRGMELK